MKKLKLMEVSSSQMLNKENNSWKKKEYLLMKESKN